MKLTNGHLSLNKDGKPIHQWLFRSMIGALLYLTSSRPDIMFLVCMCARFQAYPKESHMKAVKRILRYLNYTPSLGLWYPSRSNSKLVGFSDWDFAGCKVDRDSTTRGCHCFGRSLISWCSMKANSVAMSSSEAKYFTVGACCAQLLFLKQSLHDYGLVYKKIPLYCDNESAIKIAHNYGQHGKMKHIEIKHHFI